MSGNIDPVTVTGFGEEWAAFDQTALSDSELRRHFEEYFSVFPFENLPAGAEGFDLGCGSGRWADLMAGRVGKLHCIDPSVRALEVAQRRLASRPNVQFHLAAADTIPLENESQDFAYSLGVLHHVPDTAKAMRDAVSKLKPGAPFLVYLYYAFDNKPYWYRLLWRATEPVRWLVSRLPFPLRKRTTSALAAAVYWPLARGARWLERAGARVDNLPLSSYRSSSFYAMRTDALDRFGTRLEQRFTREQIAAMMKGAGLTDIIFREDAPYWVTCGRRA
ncbi:MAG: class I SAM-dependent methyltransferase [Sphingosinicella sp.]